MRNRSVVRVALLLAIMGVVFGLSPVLLVKADTANPVITITKPSNQDASASGGNISRMCSSVNSLLRNKGYWTTDFFDYSYDSGSGSSAKFCSITVDMVHYRKLGNKEQQETMQIALDEIYNSQISRSIKNKIYNDLCSLDETTSALVRQLSSDVRADFVKAYAYFRPWSGPLGTFLGGISLFLFAVLGVTMVFDIAYITLPFAQFALNRGDHALFVSGEAYSAVKEQHSKAGVEHVNPLTIYLKMKTSQFVAIFICLLYLVSGELYGFLATCIDYFRGLLG